MIKQSQTRVNRSMSHFGQSLFWKLFVVAVGLASSNVRAEGFRVDGQLDKTVLSPSGAILASNSYQYSIYVNDAQWKIEMSSPLSRVKNPGLVAWEAGSDGSSVFFLERYDGSMRESRPHPKLLTGAQIKLQTNNVQFSYHGQGQILSDTIPPTIQAPLGLVWLTYASTPVLARNNTGRIRQVWEFDDYTIRYQTNVTVKAFWDFTNAFPSSVQFVNEGYWNSRTSAGPKRIPVPTPFERGFTNAFFLTEAWQQFGPIKVPKVSRFRRFTAVDGQLRLIGDYKLTSNVIQVDSTQDFAPKLPGVAISIQDYREYSALGRPISYAISNAWPRAYTNITKLKTYSAQAHSAIRHKQEQSGWFGSFTKNTLLVYSAFGILIAIPIGLRIYKGKYKQNENKS